MLGERHEQIVISAMAERLPRNTVHHCTAPPRRHYRTTASKRRWRDYLIATDEGTEDEAPTRPSDRLDRVDKTTLGIHDVDDDFSAAAILSAIEMLDDVTLRKNTSALATLTASLGIDSPRPTLAAAKAARASAALRQSEVVEEEDVARALRLCLIPRAQQLPEMAEPPAEPEPEPEQTDDAEPPPMPEQPPPDEERLLEAALAQLPAGLLEQLQTRATDPPEQPATWRSAPTPNRGRPTGIAR